MAGTERQPHRHKQLNSTRQRDVFVVRDSAITAAMQSVRESEGTERQLQQECSWTTPNWLLLQLSLDSKQGIHISAY